jgi:hypothetical protein
VLNRSEFVSASTDRFVLRVSKGLDRPIGARELVSRSNSRPHLGIV